eukprot:364520-Chlamydomonas_euryale.AAC.8
MARGFSNTYASSHKFLCCPPGVPAAQAFGLCAYSYCMDNEYCRMCGGDFFGGLDINGAFIFIPFEHGWQWGGPRDECCGGGTAPTLGGEVVGTAMDVLRKTDPADILRLLEVDRRETDATDDMRIRAKASALNCRCFSVLPMRSCCAALSVAFGQGARHFHTFTLPRCTVGARYRSQLPDLTWVPSTTYTWPDMLAALEVWTISCN